MSPCLCLALVARVRESRSIVVLVLPHQVWWILRIFRKLSILQAVLLQGCTSAWEERVEILRDEWA